MPFLGGVQWEISQWRSVESVSLRRKIFCVIQTDHVSCVWIITLFKALYSSSIANINDIRWAETWNCSICSILFLVGLPFFILTPKHSPFKRGFFCNDESIRYPLKEDTISYQLLGGVMIPFTLIVVSQEYSSTTKASYFAFGQHVWLFFPPTLDLFPQIVCGECLSVYLSRVRNQSLGTKYISCLYKAVGSYVFGAAASQSLTDIAKYSIGRLRPNFLAVCNPVWDRINCKAGGYIVNFTCSGDEFLVDEAR